MTNQDEPISVARLTVITDFRGQARAALRSSTEPPFCVAALAEMKKKSAEKGEAKKEAKVTKVAAKKEAEITKGFAERSKKSSFKAWLQDDGQHAHHVHVQQPTHLQVSAQAHHVHVQLVQQVFKFGVQDGLLLLSGQADVGEEPVQAERAVHREAGLRPELRSATSIQVQVQD